MCEPPDAAGRGDSDERFDASGNAGLDRGGCSFERDFR